MKKLLMICMLACAFLTVDRVFAYSVDGYYSMEEKDGVTVYSEITNKTASTQKYSLIIACYDNKRCLTAVKVESTELEPGEVYNTSNHLDCKNYSDVKAFLWYEDSIKSLTYVDTENDTEIWDNVAIGGGGYVTGLVVHPNNSGVVYARTDVGGLYKYDAEKMEWNQLFDFVSPKESNYYGIDGIALDPNNEDIIYVASGKYDYESEHDIFRSTNGGRSFERTNFPAKFGGNMSNRTAGECIEVDPLNSKRIFVITRNEGIYKSENRGDSWEKVSGFTYHSSNNYGRIIYFDKTQKSGSYTNVIYAGLTGAGLYRSSDGGKSWAPMPGSPKDVNRIEAFGDTLFLAASDGLYSYADGEFKNITPGNVSNFGGVTVNKYNGNIAAVTKKGSNGSTDFKNIVYVSSDGGKTWRDTYSSSTYTYHADWSTVTDRRISAASAAIYVGNESDPNQIMVSDWYGVWCCDDITASAPAWYYNLEGIEETVSFTLCSSPDGYPLYAGIADVEGMFWDDVDEYPDRYLSGDQEKWQYVSSIDFCEQHPNIMVRAGGSMVSSPPAGKAAISYDYGESWTEINYPKNSNGVGAESGRICLSGDFAPGTAQPVIVTVAKNIQPHYSTDMGKTWTQCAGLPSSYMVTNEWSFHNAIASDRINPNYFYAFSGSNVYVSSDGARNFTKAATLEYGESKNVRIYASPYTEGEVWVSIEGKGLFKSLNYGKSFTKISAVKDSLFFGFGKNAPGRDNAAVYTYALIDGKWGIYRTTDRGETFVRINSDAEMMGDAPNNIVGDRQRFGVVYLTSNGRGIYYGEPTSRKLERKGMTEDSLLSRISTNADSITVKDLKAAGVTDVIDVMLDAYRSAIKAAYGEKGELLTLEEIQAAVSGCNSSVAALSSVEVINRDKYSNGYNLVAEPMDVNRLVYHAYVDKAVNNVDVRFGAIYKGEAISMNGKAVGFGEYINLSGLEYGDNVFEIEVTAADGVSHRNYTLIVNREDGNGLIENSSFGYGMTFWQIGQTSPAKGALSTTANPGWMTVQRGAAGGAIWRLGLKSNTFNIPCATNMTIEFLASTVNGKLGACDRKINVMRKIGDGTEQSAINGNGSGTVDLINGANAKYTFYSGSGAQSELTSCYIYLQTGDSGLDEADVKFKYIRLSYEGADGSLDRLNLNANGELIDLGFDPSVHEYTATVSADAVVIAAHGLHGGTTVEVNGRTSELEFINLSKGLNEIKIKGTSITGGVSEYTVYITKE